MATTGVNSLKRMAATMATRIAAAVAALPAPDEFAPRDGAPGDDPNDDDPDDDPNNYP